jgi:serine phosphatase RsbU (regulator of sigma subunit)
MNRQSHLSDFSLRIFCILLLSASSSFSFAQVNVDSLVSVYRDTSRPDSIRAFAYNNLIVLTVFTDPAGTLKYTNEFIKIAQKEKKEDWEADAYKKRGIAYRELGDYPASINDLLQALSIYERKKDTLEMAKVYNSLGALYAYKGELEKAKSYFEKSMKVVEKEGITTNHADALLNMAAISELMNDMANTFAYNRQALEMYNSMKDESGMAYVYSNLGTIYSRQDEFENLDSAIIMYKKAYELLKGLNDTKGLSNILHGIGQTYLKKNQGALAIRYCKEALDSSAKGKFLKTYMSSCKCLYTQYEKDRRYDLALQYYKEYITSRDSLVNESNTREMTQREMQFEFNKIKYEDSLNNVADSLKKVEEDKVIKLQFEQEMHQQTLYTYAGAGGFILMLGFAFILLRGYRQKQKSNKELEQKNSIITEQKLIVDEKNKEIVDSIQYAKRLQEAILPPLRFFEEHLPESFLYYKPKDIVAGDFYWMDVRAGNVILLAAADCTGHGVPGAMVSVVCSNALNRSVKEFGLTVPGEILDKVTVLVEETFSKSEGEVKDGMDISICALDAANKKMKWSGANNPLWIIRNGRNEIEEIKADKQPVGFFAGRKPFTTHHIDLQKGDTIYLFTDGLADQFGGASGKKFKYAQFKELLISIQNLSLAEQKRRIENSFESWKGDLEQVDDVCIIGIRV